MYQSTGELMPLNWVTLGASLPARAKDTHKGECGHVLVVGNGKNA